HSTGGRGEGVEGAAGCLPHCEHTARVSTRKLPGCLIGGCANTGTRLVLQVLHRLGSFLNCLSWKNSCSPVVNTKSAPQSIHFNILSCDSIEDAPSALSCEGIRPDEKMPSLSGASLRRTVTSPSIVYRPWVRPPMSRMDMV